MKKIIFIFISWLYSCFHLKQSTKSNSITKVVVCVRWKDFSLMWRHHLQIWSLQSSLQHQNLWLLNRFVFWDDCTCEVVKRLASTDFKSLNLRFTITSSGAIPLDNCLLTLSAYHNFFWNKFSYCLIYAYIQGLKLIGKIVRKGNQFKVILCT